MERSTVSERRNRRILELGERFWQEMKGAPPGLFDRRYWQGELLEWVMNDESFKIDGFRFIDVFPALRSNRAISSHVRDYLIKEGRDLPMIMRTGLGMAAGGLMSPVAGRMLRASIRAMARRFICQSDVKRAVRVFEAMGRQNLTFTADILGEATISEAEAERYFNKYLSLINVLADAADKWPDHPTLHSSSTGPLPKANVSVKLSALEPYMDEADLKGTKDRLKDRLLPLLRNARKRNVFINFDLEQWATHGIAYALFEELALHRDLIDWPHMGLVIQSYLRSSGQDFERLLALSSRRNVPFTVRLVKGAYLDYEVVHARQNGFTCPVYLSKNKTDASYEALSEKLIQSHHHLCPAFASHNLRSLVHALVLAEEHGLQPGDVEVQMLHGMAEPLRRVFVDHGYRVRIYAPIGELLPGMAYLIRRLLENTSNSGFLRQTYHERISIQNMLAPPKIGNDRENNIKPACKGLELPFVNAALLDYSEEGVVAEFAGAIQGVMERFPLKIPVVLNGKAMMSDEVHVHVSPNDPALEVSRVSRASLAQAEDALAGAMKAFPDWRDQPLATRAGLLERLAERFEMDRLTLAALQVHEVGKPWREADADVAEAIDFCRYYARQALEELAPQRQGDMFGEENILNYEGRGPTVIIAPWNFPLAILCGMTVAALVAGNPVVIKPSTAASGVAHAFYTALITVGFSGEVVHYLPGSGQEIGDFLVSHPFTAQVAFTGSKEVGLGIVEKAAKTRDGQIEVKRVICEMGGKNAIIVDEDADLDAALKGVIQSAFGYAGQKCSACSRVILVGGVYEPFVQRLLEACAGLPTASATEPVCRLGPVINSSAWRRLDTLIAEPPPGAELLFKGQVPEVGFFVPPAVFAVSDPVHPLMRDELFGPIVAVIGVDDFQAALDVANRSEFALTGGLYSRSPSNMTAAKMGFKVGNLYINRSCTGAVVGRQPFGGFKMSGIGTKAGGPGYLRNFTNTRCITENTMRSGFTPDLQL